MSRRTLSRTFALGAPDQLAIIALAHRGQRDLVRCNVPKSQPRHTCGVRRRKKA